MVQNKPISIGNPDDPKHLRLTLRTLLAYLDDVLEPAQAREIGTKIQETQYASQLVDRIQDVLRRRRVAAPDLIGPGSGLDPNTVAEYLDNTLAPPSVSDVERVCLESDMHLAEVAACHQILTLVLGDPLHVSAESRERLHALIPAALAHQSQPQHATSPAAKSSAAKKPAQESAAPALQHAAAQAASAKAPAKPSTNGGGRGATPVSPRFSETIPEYLKPKPLWKRALVPTFVVLVLMLWLGLLIYDPSLIGTGPGQPDEVAQTDQQPPAQAESKTPATQTEAEDDQEADSETLPAEPPAKTTPDEPTTKPAIPIDAQPPEDKKPAEEVAVNKIAVPETEEPATKPAELPEQTEPALAETPEAKTPEQTEPVLPPPAVEVVYTTKEVNTVTKGMLLRHDAAQQEWGTLPYRTKVILGEQLACPEPLDAVFSISKTDCEVTFIGGVLASFQPLKSPEAFSLNLSQGKVLFTRPDSDSEEPSVLCSVIVEDDVLQLELSTNARCGLEILPRFPNQFEKSLGPHWYTGRLWVDSGQVRFTDRTGNKYLLAAKQALDISPDQSSETPPTVEADLIMPDWLNPLSRTFTSQTARYMRQIHGAFEAADVESDVTLVLLPLAKNDKTPPAVAVMAAKTLAMTGCVRDVADLLSLNEASPEELRLAAIEGTRRWLTLHPDKEHGQSLRDALGRNFQKDTASAIYRLLWGYRKSDLKNGSEGLRLVDQLMDPNITVRTLAFLHLYELTNKTNNYRPLDPESQRRNAVSRWREDVSGGKIFN